LPSFSSTGNKIKEGILIVPEIRNLTKDKNFYALLKGTEKAAWEAFKVVVDNFLGKPKDPTTGLCMILCLKPSEI
jgi:hypothetical protein